MILIQLREDGGDLTLAIGVVERVVDVRRKNAQARSSIAVNHEGGEQALVQLIVGHVAQFRQGLELVHKTYGPIGKLFGVDVFEAVLELRTADAVFYG